MLAVGPTPPEARPDLPGASPIYQGHTPFKPPARRVVEKEVRATAIPFTGSCLVALILTSSQKCEHSLFGLVLVREDPWSGLDE